MPKIVRDADGLPLTLEWTKVAWASYAFEPGLQACSLPAQGAYLRLMSLAADGMPFGHVAVNGRGFTPRQIAALLGTDLPGAVALLEELEQAGLFLCRASLRPGYDDELQAVLSEMEGEGAFPGWEATMLFSRRLVRDLYEQRVAIRNGRKGGNPALKRPVAPEVNQGVKGGVNPIDKKESVQPSADGRRPSGAGPDLFGEAPKAKPRPGAELYHFGMPIVTKMTGRPDAWARAQITGWRKQCGNDDARILETLRKAEKSPPDDLVSYVHACLRAPVLVVDNATPGDPWGIDAFCRQHPDIVPAEGRDAAKGNWVLDGVHMFDKVAKRVVIAARLPDARAVDLAPLVDWLRARVNPDLMATTIERLAAGFSEPATNLRPFHHTILNKGRPAA